MNYTVVWKPEAERRLTELWVEANDKASVTAAANRIDAELHDEAHLKGESREGDFRVLLIYPMGVFFQSNSDDRIATVLSVWLFGDL